MDKTYKTNRIKSGDKMDIFPFEVLHLTMYFDSKHDFYIDPRGAEYTGKPVNELTAIKVCSSTATKDYILCSLKKVGVTSTLLRQEAAVAIQELSAIYVRLGPKEDSWLNALRPDIMRRMLRAYDHHGVRAIAHLRRHSISVGDSKFIYVGYLA